MLLIASDFLYFRVLEGGGGIGCFIKGTSCPLSWSYNFTVFWGCCCGVFRLMRHDLNPYNLSIHRKIIQMALGNSTKEYALTQQYYNFFFSNKLKTNWSIRDKWLQQIQAVKLLNTIISSFFYMIIPCQDSAFQLTLFFNMAPNTHLANPPHQIQFNVNQLLTGS